MSQQQVDIEQFDFRTIHPKLRVGTCSDRYAGWLGQIYPPEMESAAKKRRRKLGGKSFEERVLPIESVRHYFEHFSILELDFTFYRPLLDEIGDVTPSHKTLASYAEHAPSHARFVLKAPQMFFARRLRRFREGRMRFEENPQFLDSDAYVAQFLEPASAILKDRLTGIIFQQEYLRVKESPSEDAMLMEFESFFAGIPEDTQSHIELRSPHLLTPGYFEWLAAREMGHTFTHWTWMPPIKEQWRLCGEAFHAGDQNVLLRLLTPLEVKYADAYAKSHPFDKVNEDLRVAEGTRAMIDEATALSIQAINAGGVMNVLTNNRAYGNAPELAKELVKRFLEFEDRIES